MESKKTPLDGDYTNTIKRELPPRFAEFTGSLSVFTTYFVGAQRLKFYHRESERSNNVFALGFCFRIRRLCRIIPVRLFDVVIKIFLFVFRLANKTRFFKYENSKS